MSTPRETPALVVLVRIAGNVFAVRRVGARLVYRRLRAARPGREVPDQTGALALLRWDRRHE